MEILSVAYQRIEKKHIERARQLLLSKIYRRNDDGQYLKRQAIKELLAQLIAARENGLSFEEIAASFKEAGLELSPLTLRAYYFDLKTNEEISKSVRKHADKINKTKQAIDQKMLEIHSKHAEQIALAHTSDIYKHTQFFDALTVQNPPSLNNNAALNKPPPLQTESSATAIVKGENSDKASHPTHHETNTDASVKNSAQHSLAAIERNSLETNVRSNIDEDLLLKDEFVFYASGKPFIGTLSKKQIHLLRSAGKIVAPIKGRSSADFVAMQSNL